MTRISPIYFVLVLSLILNIVPIWFGLPSYEGWFADEILPHHVRSGLEQRFSQGWHRKYPPLHYYLLTLVHSPVLLTAKLLKLDPSTLSLYTTLMLLSRLMSIVMAAGIVFLVYKIGLEILSQRPAIFASLITSLVVPFVHYSKTANPDIPYLFWFTLSLFYFVRLMKTRTRKYYLFFALTAVLSVSTKDHAYALYILPIFSILCRDWKLRKKANPALTVIRFISDPTYLFAVAVALATFVLVYNLTFNSSGFILHLKALTGPLRENYQLYPHTLSGHLSVLGRGLDQVRFSMGWPLFGLSIAGILAALASKPRNLHLLSLLLFALSTEIFFIHVIMYNYARFYLPACIILSFFGGQFLSSLLRSPSRFDTLVRAAVMAIFAYSFIYAFSVDLLMIKDSRYAAEKWIKKNIPAHAKVGMGVWPVYGPRLGGINRFIMDSPFMDLRKLSSQPDYIILTTEFTRRYLLKPNGKHVFTNFFMEQGKYKLVYRYRTPLSWLPLSQRELAEQINKINPEVLILKKR